MYISLWRKQGKMRVNNRENSSNWGSEQGGSYGDQRRSQLNLEIKQELTG